MECCHYNNRQIDFSFQKMETTFLSNYNRFIARKLSIIGKRKAFPVVAWRSPGLSILTPELPSSSYVVMYHLENTLGYSSGTTYHTFIVHVYLWLHDLYYI